MPSTVQALETPDDLPATPSGARSGSVLRGLPRRQSGRARLPDTLTEVPIIRLVPGRTYAAFRSQADEPRRLVVRDQRTWDEVWADVGPSHPTLDGQPDVDFSREVVIVAAYGQTVLPNTICVESAAASSAGLTVWVRRTSYCNLVDELANPTDVVRIPRTDQAVRFVETEQFAICTR